MRPTLLFLLYVFLITITGNQALAFNDGLEALQKKKYDKAFTNFKDALEKNPDDVAALYGMSKLLSSPDYKMYDLEKAYVHVINAKNVLPYASEKVKKKLQKSKINEETIIHLQNTIDSIAFVEVTKQNTIEAVDTYLDIHKSSLYADKASEL